MNVGARCGSRGLTWLCLVLSPVVVSLSCATPAARPDAEPVESDGSQQTLGRSRQALITNAAVRPVLECVDVLAGDGGYRAHFGYKNDNEITVAIPVGTNNRFNPNPQDRGQVTTFLVGRQVDVFTVVFPGGNLVWTLKGPDNLGRTSTASPSSKKCVATQTFYRDADGDGFGNIADTISAETQPSGYVTNSQDCDDTRANVFPGAVDVCDGLDNDCDTVVDEDFSSTSTNCGVGACARTGSTSCVAGAVQNSCTPGTPAFDDSLCNAIDDDCDGGVDEDFAPTATSCGVGACTRAGNTACVAGAVQSSCSPGTPAADDSLCNAIDDDCDGPVDEDFVSSSTSCGLGACARTGVTACSLGAVVDSCAPGSPATSDAVCNAIDDDCDGPVDEDFVSSSTSCGVGACAAAGATSCVAGAVQDSCAPGSPATSDATCNGVDEDCSGAVDEDYASTCSGDNAGFTTCVSGGVVVTACTDNDACNGAETCVADIVGVRCEGGTPPTLDDGDPCTTDVCDAEDGVSHPPAPSGTSCTDGDACNGQELCTGTGVCVRTRPPTEGPCAPAGPTAAIFVDESRNVTDIIRGASLVSFTGSNTPTFDTAGLEWSPSILASGPEVVLDLADTMNSTETGAVIDHVVLSPNGSTPLKAFELYASASATGPWEEIASLEAPNTGTDNRLDFHAARARFVKLRVLSNWTNATKTGGFAGLKIFTADRSGGAVSLFEAGVAVSASSNSSTASRATDYASSTLWQSATGPVAGQTVTVDLPGTAPITIDRVRLFARTGTRALRGFEVWVSRTTDTPAAYTRVLIGELPQRSPSAYQYYFFPETTARYVRLNVLTNHGFATGVDVNDFQVFTPHQGPLAVAFEDRSTVGANPIDFWKWSFGDGTTSAEPFPKHTYRTPGEYIVTLEVRDSYGVTSRASYVYRAYAPPEAFFLSTPNAPVQRDRITFTDKSRADLGLLRSDFTIDSLATGSGTPGATLQFDTVAQVNVPASVTATDKQLQVSTYSDVIPIANISPTISIADDQRVFWGQNYTPMATRSVADIADAFTCSVDFGDGTVTSVPGNCTVNTILIPHTWSTPGTYDVAFKVTDTRGATTEDRLFVEVIRRDTNLGIDPVSGAATGGSHPVVVRLGDRFDGRAVAGRTVSLTAFSTTQNAVTDASGAATFTVDFGAGGASTLSAQFAGDSLYVGSSATATEPVMLEPVTASNCGTEYMFSMPSICRDDGNCGVVVPSHRDTIMVTGAPGTLVSIEQPGIGYFANVMIEALGSGGAGVGEVRLPPLSFAKQSGIVNTHAFHIRSPRVVCTFVIGHQPTVSDGITALPVNNLGTEYVLGAYRSSQFPVLENGEFTVTAVENNTVVTVTPTARFITPSGQTPVGVPFNVTLHRGETIQYRLAQNLLTDFDPTGTTVVATKPVSVVSGNFCANVPSNTQACNYLAEQMIPTSRWGSEFIVPPLATRNGYVLRVVASQNGTGVTVDGVLAATLNRGQFYERTYTTRVPALVTTSHPAQVLQYSRSRNTDGAVGDPFMTTIVPTVQFGNRYTIDTALPNESWQFTNYVNLVAPTANVGGVRIDGAPVVAAWSVVPGSSYSYAMEQVTPGPHRIEHLLPTVNIGSYVYGWQADDAYGYPGFLRLNDQTAACSATTMVSGDGVDDECDGRIDEEDANGVDDDGDSLVDEDLRAGFLGAVNILPVAYDRRDATREDTALTVVLAAFDANGDAITYELLSSPVHGTLTPIGSGGQVYSYTPVANYNGEDVFTYRACDGLGCSASATFDLTVRNINDAPTLVVPILNVTEDRVAKLPCVTSDVDDIDLTCVDEFVLVSGPIGMSIDSKTGDLFWLPTEEYSDQSVPVTVKVTDCLGASTTFSFAIGVAGIPDAPVITSEPITEGHVGATYIFDVNATDPDPFNNISYELVTRPLGMNIIATSGLITWPTPVAGTHPIEIVARDQFGLTSDPLRYDLVITAIDTKNPVGNLVLDTAAVLPGETVTITFTATDNDGVASRVVTVNGDPIALDLSGGGTFTPSTAGVYEVVATATDNAGNSVTSRATIRALIEGDAVAPVISLTSPTDTAELTYIHEVVGSVNDPNLYRWSVDVRAANNLRDPSGWRTLLSGSGNASGTLGQLDTTSIRNGYHVLRFRAEDINGNANEVVRPIRIEGNAKPGLVHLEFTDMVLPAFGFDLAVRRIYDTRDATQRLDFGYGWSLDISQGQITRNRAPGDGWAIYSRILDPNACVYQDEQLAHFVEVRLSDNDWYVFKPVVVNTQPVSGGCSGEVVYEFVDGVTSGAELFAFGDRAIRSTPWGVVTPFDFLPYSQLKGENDEEIYDPQEFRMELKDGRKFNISMSEGITYFEDNNGNKLFAIPEGFVHNSSDGLAARQMTFVRDGEQRITQIVDSSGRSVGYSYDATGNLVEHLDVLGRKTRFEYGAGAAYAHHLTDIIDFRGTRLAAIEYTSDGRLGKQCDPDGVCQRSTYDLDDRIISFIDNSAQLTRYSYDFEGNIASAIDPLGRRTDYDYSSSGRLSGRRDPSGAYTDWRYYVDFGRFPLERIDPHEASEDPDEFSTKYEMDELNGELERVIKETLPTGGAIHRAYDANGNEIERQDDSGRVIWARTYGANGELLTETDRHGTTTFTYGVGNAVGRPTRITRPEGAYDLAYDARGNLTQVLGTSGAHVGRAMRFAYDAGDRRTYANYGQGVEVRFSYSGNGDATNQWTKIESPTFGTYERSFYGSGRLRSTTMPNGDVTSRVYDAMGRIRETTDATGNVTRSNYDAAGQLFTSVDVGRGATTTYEYNLDGRLIAEENTFGERTEYTLDIRGNVIETLDARNHTSTSLEKPLFSENTDAVGNTTRSVRNAYGLTTRTEYPGNVATLTTYLGSSDLESSSDYPLTQTDELSRVRALSYDARSGLSSATDLGGDAWSYTYAPFLGTELDVNLESGEITLSRPESTEEVHEFRSYQDPPAPTTGSALERSTFLERTEPYDLGGLGSALSTLTSPEGDVTTWTRNTAGRIASIAYPHGGTETRSYDASTGYLATQTLAHGTTLTFGRDASGRVQSRAGTDGSNQTFTYGVDDRVATASNTWASITENTTHTYDVVGRQTGIVLSSGRFNVTHDALDRTTRVESRAPGVLPASPATSHVEYTYDEVGNVETITDRRGLVTTFAYDAANRLTTRTFPNGIVSSWTYDNRHRIESVTHKRGTTVIASAAYVRSASGEPTRITREDGSYVIVSYDPAVRIESEQYFDASDVLLETIAYTYDDDGNRATRITAAGLENYAYNAGARLSAITGARSVSYGYDTGGRTTSITEGAVTTNIAYDADDHIVGIGDSTEESRFAYDATGRRVKRDVVNALGTETHRDLTAATLAGYESPHLVTDASGAVEASYVFNDEHPLIRFDASGDALYYLEDAMGSVIGLTDTAGTAASTIHYDGFGNERAVTGSLATSSASATAGDFRFHGMWLDEQTGLYYVRARTYDATTGRFLTRDPAEGVRSRPETYAAYGFANANPFAWADPSGESALDSLNALIVGLQIRIGYATAALTTALGPFGQRIRDGLLSLGPKVDVRRLEHIFRSAPGHVERVSSASQARYMRLFERVAADWSNLRADAVEARIITQAAENAGVRAFTWDARFGQVWVVVRNGLIENAGVNPPGMFR